MNSLKVRASIPWVTLVLIAAAGSLVLHRPLHGAEAAAAIPPPVIDNPLGAGPLQSAVLAGGCFWGVQAVFEHVHGVRKVVAGYAGGDRSSAEYDTVSTGATGHAESVRITFDPAQITYGQLLNIAFSVVHDPTQLNRQGPDSGTQYRSAIFYADETQKHIAEAYIAQLDRAHAFPRAIATRLEPLRGFYPAEGYHQDYLIRHLTQYYIVVNDLPKIENLRRLFPQLYEDQPVLYGAR
ncbi:MAG: peptide-methionine (S)-S-oxide reductase MsrA [Steroidobacterales bacterium]